MSKIIHQANPSSSSIENPTHRFYRTVWRWHFYAGLFVIPFLLILSVTGIVYLFKPQLDGLMYSHQLFVQPAGVIQPYSQQLAAVQRAYPEAKVTKVTPAIAPNRSTEVTLTTADERNLAIFVNPYTSQVLGDRDEDYNLQAIARKIHGELLIGKSGDYLVELAACWGLVLLVSGLYLWLPRRGMGIMGTLIPRLWSRNRRIFWRDLHAVPGFYGIILIGFLILTGLPWSGFWGETFVQVWNQFPTYVFSKTPESTLPTGSLNQHGAQVVPWAVEKMPMPHSQPSGHQNHQAGNSSTSAIAPTSIDLGQVVALAQSKGAPAGYSISFPEDETGVYTVSAFPADPTQEITMHIDQYSGQVLAAADWNDYGLFPRAVEMGIAIHMGRYFGLGNQLLMLAGCLIVILLCVTGVVMWWRRRPTGRLGAPTLPEYTSQWRVPLAILAVLGLVFPLVGFSLLIVLALDYFVLSRMPGVKRIFN